MQTNGVLNNNYNLSIMFIFAGSIILSISTFYPYMIVSVPSGSTILINGFGYPFAFLFLAISILFGILTCKKFTKSTLREDFWKVRILILISIISGIISIILYVLFDIITAQSIYAPMKVNIFSEYSFGFGFLCCIFGWLMNVIGLFVLIKSFDIIPSRLYSRKSTFDEYLSLKEKSKSDFQSQLKIDLSLTLLVLGTAYLIVSYFFPFIEGNFYNKITFYSFSLPSVYLLTLVASVFRLLTIRFYNRIRFREEFYWYKRFAMIASVVSVISSILYLIYYSSSYNSLMGSTENMNPNQFVLSDGFYTLFLASIIIALGYAVINEIHVQLPSKQERNSN